MDQARWDQVQSVFHQASHLDEPERSAFLASACAGDADLLGEVRAMLAADAGIPSIFDRSIDEIAAQILETPGGSIAEQQFGPYRLTRLLGEGGMGVVWLAERLDAGNLVAIKFLPHAGLSPSRRERFAREIRTLAKLRHPYIARLYDAGTLEDGTPWFVMEYVEGACFADYSREPGRSIPERILLFRRVCEAVQYAHGQEIIHRDLKPSNILVAKDGTPRLLDFGIAREMQQLDDAGDLTRAGLRFFSADYSAPEWVRDGVIGFNIDVYSLGVILYEMLTGQLPSRQARPGSERSASEASDSPVEKPSQVARRTQRDTGTAERLSTAAWNELDVLCLKAMHGDPEERYPSVEALLRDIDHYLRHEPLEARPDTLIYRANRFFRRNRAAVLAATAALLLIAGTIIFFTVRLARARNAALAEAARERRIEQFMLSFMGNGSAPPQSLTVLKVLDRSTESLRTLRDDPETQAEIYYTLARAYGELNQLDKTDKMLELGLEKARTLGDPNRQSAELLIQLAVLRGDQANYADADRTIHRALDQLAQLHLRTDDPLVSLAHVAFGKILVEDGSYSKAVAELEPITNLVPTNDDARVNQIDALNYLAVAKQYAGDPAAAESINRRSLDLERTVYGDSSPRVAETLANIGTAEATLGHYADAENLFRRSASILDGYYGANNPETVQVESFAGLMALHNHDYPTAEKLLRNVLPLQEQEYGSAPDPNIAFTHDVLGQLAEAQGDLRTAEAEFQIGSGMMRSLYGELDLKTAQAMSNLGNVLVREGQYARAEAVLQPSVKAFTQRPLPGNMNVPTAELRLGKALLGEKRFKDALKLLSDAYESLKTGPPSFAGELADAGRELIEVYNALHEPDKAASLQTEIANAASARRSH